MAGPWERYQQPAPAQPAPAASGPWTRYQKAVPAADFSDVTGSVSTTAGAPKERTTGQKIAREVGGLGLRNVVEGAADLLGIIYDPIADAVNWAGEKGPTLSSLVTGERERYFPKQARAREISDMALDAMGVPKPENAQERVAGDVGRALTGTALTMGAGGLLNAGRSAAANPSAVSRLGDLLTAQPNWQVASSITGAGSAGATREAGGGAGSQALAGLVGGMGPQSLTAGLAAATRGLVRGTGAPMRDPSQLSRLQQMQQNIGDFSALGATPSVGQASGNRVVQGLENLLAGAPTSTGVMTRFAERQADDIGEGLKTAAERLSPRASAERAGRAVEKGTETFANNTKAMKKALYWQADQFIPGTTQMPLTRTQRALQELTTPVTGAEATTGSLIKPRMQQMADDVKADIAAAQAAGGNGIPYEAVKKIRSDIGEQLSDFSLSVDRPTAELKRLYAALSQDLEEAARAAGPQAERAARRANNYTRAVADRLEQVQRVIDKNGGPEQVFNSAMSGTRDGGTTLRAVMQSLPKEGQQALTAAVIKRMGLATPGAQDAAGDVFSSGTFMTNWSKLSPEAKRSLFDRYGKGFSENMDRIARVASNIKEGSKVYANPSGTANRAAALTYGASLVASLFDPTFITTGSLVGGGGVARYMAGRLTNPDFVAWLANSTAVPVGSALGYIQSLRATGMRKDDPELVEAADTLAAEYRKNQSAGTDNQQQ